MTEQRLWADTHSLIVDYQGKTEKAGRKLYRDRYNRPKGFYFTTADCDFYGPFDTQEEAKEAHTEHMKSVYGVY